MAVFVARLTRPTGRCQADGVLHKRTLLAQNPMTNSGTAQQAKNGWRIMHLIDGDAAFEDKSKWLAQVRLAPGGTHLEFIDKRRRS